MQEGCERGGDCVICENDGVGCTTKRAVYKATCDWCTDGGGDTTYKYVRDEATYIGETSRQVGRRVQEHVENLIKWNPESFILDHWVRAHGLSTTPPAFSFKVMGSHKDALSRQLHEAILIGKEGFLNKKSDSRWNQAHQ